jgi:ribonuclease M5
MFELGLSGGNDSSNLRKKLQSRLGLPSMLSAGALLEVLNTMMTAAELREHIAALKEIENDL